MNNYLKTKLYVTLLVVITGQNVYPITTQLRPAPRPSAGQYYPTLTAIAQAGNTELLKQNVAQGANINEQDQFGMTPLMAAAQYGRLATVVYLLNANANKSYKDSRGETADEKAGFSGYPEIAELIRDHNVVSYTAPYIVE